MTLERAGLLHQPFYCEENVWHLARHPELRALDRYVVFVSNARRQVPMWCQRACPDPDSPVVWDYHVFLVADGGAGWRVFDLDTTLPFGVPLAEYARRSFRIDRAPYAPRFAIVEAGAFEASFATDRSHMLRDDGTYQAPPPPWPTIGEGTNLDAYVGLQRGEVVDLAGLVVRFSR